MRCKLNVALWSFIGQKSWLSYRVAKGVYVGQAHKYDISFFLTLVDSEVEQIQP